MTRDETALGAALKRAGLTESTRLHAVISQLLKDAGGGRAKVRETLRSKVMASTELLDALLDCAIAAVAEDMQGSPGAGLTAASDRAEGSVPASGDAAHEMSGGGQRGGAEKAIDCVPPTRQQNGDGAGSARNSDSGTRPLSRPSPTSRGVGAMDVVPKGQGAVSPAREPSDSRRRGLLAAHKSAALAVNRSLGWIGELYTDKGRPIADLTVGEIEGAVKRLRHASGLHISRLVSTGHVAIVLRKIKERIDEQGVAQPDMRWVDILTQTEIDQIRREWTKENVSRETIRHLSGMNEHALEMLLEQHNAA